MIQMFEKKTATVDITVKTNDVAKDITGGTPRAVAIAPNGGKKTLTATITDASGGVIQILFPIGLVDTHGSWLAELALEIGTDDRTVWQEDVLAAQSFT